MEKRFGYTDWYRIGALLYRCIYFSMQSLTPFRQLGSLAILAILFASLFGLGDAPGERRFRPRRHCNTTQELDWLHADHGADAFGDSHFATFDSVPDRDHFHSSGFPLPAWTSVAFQPAPPGLLWRLSFSKAPNFRSTFVCRSSPPRAPPIG